jgi:MYXO-CTERM domain-containing protein
MNDLEQKKQMLIAESEVCRQALRLELQNLRLFTAQTKQRFRTFGVPKQTWLLAAAGVFSFWMRRRRRRFSMWRLGGVGVLGWKVFQRVAPFCKGMLAGRRERRQRRMAGPTGRLWQKNDISAA